ncbi:hypothetical protein [Yoonia algicola]|jgi:hypothetical protein|uniref:Uncharacterized protein n=1 Tax=Yoonia algicola TaxID=3137368 RepID=A0AAN0M4X1_9RHOB
MGRDWIIDVLADLRSFARDNDLPLLRAQLEEAELVAQVEIASHPAHDTRQHWSEPEAMFAMNTKAGPPRRS